MDDAFPDVITAPVYCSETRRPSKTVRRLRLSQTRATSGVYGMPALISIVMALAMVPSPGRRTIRVIARDRRGQGLSDGADFAKSVRA